jgi:uncharacterized protein YggE
MFRLLSVLALAFLLLLPAIASADDAKIVRSISVSGHGEVQAVPDLATISMGVMTSSITAKEALTANSKAMNELMEVLEKAGIEAKDIATSNFNVGPRYDYGQGGSLPPKLVGYEVSNVVTVIVRKIDAMGDVLDAGVSAGSNQIHGISFSVSKPDAKLDEARKEAVADARRKAEIYAAAGGIALGQIISLNEGGGYQPPMPMAKTMAAEAAGAPPIAQGEQTLAIDVNVVWEIK